MRKLPPRSLPFASQTMPVASATAEPPDEPPQVSAVFQGLRVLPNTSLKVFAPAPNSEVLERATTMPPRRSRVSTWMSEVSGTKSAKIGEPEVERTPATFIRSLIAMGRPPSQPGAPRSTLLPPMRRAWSRACSTQIVGSALTAGSTARMRASDASISSKGVTSPLRKSSTTSRAVRRIRTSPSAIRDSLGAGARADASERSRGASTAGLRARSARG